MYIPDDLVSWSISWSGYKPISFTTAKITAQPVYADDHDTTFVIYSILPNDLNNSLFLKSIKMD